MFKSVLYTLGLIVISNFAVAQKMSFVTNKDSIANKQYDYFRLRYQETKSLPISAIYAKKWLEKAKEENNHQQLVLAYQAVLYKAEKQFRISYTDSILTTALQTKDNALIGGAYLTKGTTYYDLKKHNLALDNYIKASEYISNTKDNYLIYKVKYTIAQTKLYLGFYDEAIALFTECLDYFEEENDRAYLNTLHSLGLCYNKIKKYDLCTQFNKKGKQIGESIQNHEMDSYFDLSEGINQYFKSNYQKSIELINNSLPSIKNRNDEANKIISFFYLGKNYLALHQKSKALNCFLQVDKELSDERFLRPDIRENFEFIIQHYNTEKNLKKELYYIKKLIQVDKVLNSNFRYLSTKIHKEYDTKVLRSNIAEIEYKLKRNEIIYTIAIILLVILISYLIDRHFKLQRKYRRKFEKLMATQQKFKKTVVSTEHSGELDIAIEVVNNILKNLERFEKEKKYIEKDMSTTKLADILQTNTKYVSKIIPKYRGKKTINYISDLKIDYIVDLLKSERMYRNYTNQGLADTAGFGSTQNFTASFKARTGISPTYFIQELKKLDNSNT